MELAAAVVPPAFAALPMAIDASPDAVLFLPLSSAPILIARFPLAVFI